MISLIAAVGKNGEIGISNDLIWHLKEDMKYFKETTLNHKIIMGKNTYSSIGRPLPNRFNIVLTTHPKEIKDDNIHIYTNMADLVKDLKKEEEVFVIGGAKIYEEFITLASSLYLTEIEDICPKATAYFPKFNLNEWHKIVLKEVEENNLKYTFTKYERITK